MISLADYHIVQVEDVKIYDFRSLLHSVWCKKLSLQGPRLTLSKAEANVVGSRQKHSGSRILKPFLHSCKLRSAMAPKTKQFDNSSAWQDDGEMVFLTSEEPLAPSRVCNWLRAWDL